MKSNQHENSTQSVTTEGMIYTLGVNLALFFFFIAFFEANRLYKQIFLKRLQRRFVLANKVPPEPSGRVFGWLYAIMNVQEIEVLHMIGLDGYMLLRFHVFCIK